MYFVNIYKNSMLISSFQFNNMNGAKKYYNQCLKNWIEEGYSVKILNKDGELWKTNK